FADKYDIPKYYGSYEELVEDEEIDVIYIPTVNALHYEHARMALAHHKHVIVEKPFTVNKAQAEALFDYARAQNCFLMEAQKIVFLPATEKTIELLESGVIGELKYIELKAGHPNRFDYSQWMFDVKMGGGALYGSATYTIEYMQHVFKNPKLVMNANKVNAPTGTDDLCTFTMVMNDKIMVTSTIAMNAPLVNEAVFYGDKGLIRVPNYWKAKEVILEVYNEEKVVYPFPYTSEFKYEVNHINACIEKGLLTSPVITKEMTLETTSMVEEAYKQWGLI
ncbi:MAG: Gfo/Idh/MocA family oxidoreductase, partial [Erysipelotrichaceae bacterium]|nr:Gfo/Idh/MocA family oxidoreductase [Erysipelotrichaceae bacterium]